MKFSLRHLMAVTLACCLVFGAAQRPIREAFSPAGCEWSGKLAHAFCWPFYPYVWLASLDGVWPWKEPLEHSIPTDTPLGGLALVLCILGTFTSLALCAALVAGVVRLVSWVAKESQPCSPA